MGILESAAAKYATVHGLCAEFEQELEVTLLRRTVRSSGTLCQEAPDRFSMRFRDPEGDLVVADGEWIWLYYPSTDPRQVVRAPLDRAGGRFDFHREFLERPAERYSAQLEGPDAVGGVPVQVLAIEPRGDSPFIRARLWVDTRRGLILKLETEEPNGSVRTVVLSDLRLNPEIPAEIFRFDPPPDADVITRG